MKANGAKEQALLVGRIRQDDIGTGGDIVIMRTTHRGVERLKIFQREQQNVLNRGLHRLYDWVRGNVNCTSKIEDLLNARANARKGIDESFQEGLGDRLRSIHDNLTQSARPRSESPELFELLSTIEVSACPSNLVELHENPWDADRLVETSRRCGLNFSETGLEWLAMLAKQPDKALTSDEIDRFQILIADAAGAKNGRLKRGALSPEQGSIVREWYRQLYTVRAEPIRYDREEFARQLFERFTRSGESEGPDRIASCISTLVVAMQTPDIKPELQQETELLSALAFLHEQWKNLYDEGVEDEYDRRRVDDTCKLPLAPLIFKVEQACLDLACAAGGMAILARLPLSENQIQFMADDLRRCLAERKARPLAS